MIYIGIDAGRKTGVALWDAARQKFNRVSTLDFWGLINLLDQYREIGTDFFRVVIENPNLNKPTFARKGETRQMGMKRSQDVGRNKEQSFLIMEYCKNHKIPFTDIRPTQTKWSSETFKRLTGYTGRTNEHTRDAARLVWKLK